MAGEHLYNPETVAEPWEFEEVKTEGVVLKTNLERCLVCGVGDIVRHNRGRNKEPILIYSRNGTFVASHHEYICNNQNNFKPCRVSYFYGYYKVKGKTKFCP